MIDALLDAGKRVGVTANSHKVILQVLEQVASERGAERIVHMGTEDHVATDSVIPVSKNYADIAQGLASGQLMLVGGNVAGLVASKNAGNVRHAGHRRGGSGSLANALAIAGAADNLVLFGDPAQLDQAQKGIHPAGADVSALGHLLGDAAAMPDDRGIFIARTRRLHPNVCRFTSELFYDGKLQSQPGLERQEVVLGSELAGSGLLWMPVEHAGNTNRSDEEVERIESLVGQLLAPDTR